MKIRGALFEVTTVHRGAFCQFPFQWIYYYGSNKSTGKETGKMHLCAVQWLGWNFIESKKEKHFVMLNFKNEMNLEFIAPEHPCPL